MKDITEYWIIYPHKIQVPLHKDDLLYESRRNYSSALNLGKFFEWLIEPQKCSSLIDEPCYDVAFFLQIINTLTTKLVIIVINHRKFGIPIRSMRSMQPTNFTSSCDCSKSPISLRRNLRWAIVNHFAHFIFITREFASKWHVKTVREQTLQFRLRCKLLSTCNFSIYTSLFHASYSWTRSQHCSQFQHLETPSRDSKRAI